MGTSAMTLTEIIVAHAAIFGYAAIAWVPLVFFAYALGRKQVTMRLLLTFTTAEAVALALALWIRRVL